jgi:hypothetical protein
VKPIHLIPLAGSGGNGFSQEPALDLLEQLAAALVRSFRVPCRIRPETLELDFAFDGAAASIIRAPSSSNGWSAAPIRRARLGRHLLRLYVPVLTFVFGEAQLRRQLRGGLDGAPGRVLRHAARDDLLRERLVKEAVARVGPHVRPAALRGLALRDGVEPRGPERLDVKSLRCGDLRLAREMRIRRSARVRRSWPRSRASRFAPVASAVAR